MATALSPAPTIIKPHDIVRTPDGRTGEVHHLLPGGFRSVTLETGERVSIHVSELYLVRAAVPVPWPTHKL